MDTSVYIANRELRVISGRAAGKTIEVKDYAHVTLPEGAVINGVVTDEREFTKAFKYVMEKNRRIAYKNISLTLGSTQIYVKKAVVPEMSDKHLSEWMKDEFSDIGTEKDLVYDYAVLDASGKTGTTVLLCAAKRELISGYIELFSQLGVSISCIDTARNSLIKLLRIMKPGDTYIALAFDGNSLEAALFIDGIFCVANKTRLLEQRGTAESFAEVDRMASSLIQFNSAERSGRNISSILLMGDVKEAEALGANLNQTFGLESHIVTDDKKLVKAPADFDIAAYCYAAGNLVRV